MIDNEKNYALNRPGTGYALNRPGTGYVELPVTGGYVTKVDLDIAEILKGKSIWNSRGHLLYPSIWNNGKEIKLHRFIMNAESNQMIDHINGDTFDNRRSNLRICSRSINRINSHSSVKSYSGFRGVYYRKDSNKFIARLNYNKKRISFGDFHNKYIAAIFRDLKVSKILKIPVNLNFNKSINENDLSDFLNSTNGKIIKICFMKRSDCSFREMTCRLRVSKNLKGKGMAYDTIFHNLIVVYDMHKQSHKCIPIENIVCFSFAKKNYIVSRNRLRAVC